MTAAVSGRRAMSDEEKVILTGSIWWLLGCVLVAMALGALLCLLVT